MKLFFILLLLIPIEVYSDVSFPNRIINRKTKERIQLSCVDHDLANNVCNEASVLFIDKNDKAVRVILKNKNLAIKGLSKSAQSGMLHLMTMGSQTSPQGWDILMRDDVYTGLKNHLMIMKATDVLNEIQQNLTKPEECDQDKKVPGTKIIK
jgi:hypothetical protein